MTENSNEPIGEKTKAKTKPKAKAKRRSSSGKKKPQRGGARTGAGRTRFTPTIEQRMTVEEMKFCGEAETVIARAIGIDVDTLRVAFVDELASGHAQRRKEVIGLLFKEARAGNVSAIRRLDEIGRAAREQEKANKPNREPAPLKLGKKAEQQQAAERVAGKFAVPEPPRLVVDNR